MSAIVHPAVQHHHVQHSRRILYLTSTSPIRLLRIFTCKRIGLSLVLSLVFIAAFLNISARIDYSLDLQILNNNHRPDGGSPIFTTFGTSFKVRKVARKMASQFLLIFQRHLYHVQLHSSDNITVDGEPSGSH
ncbi:uncharacterized protein K444DRAFT_616159 [Hyaloscypha bicolor E]|uniref:Uncharacterized protein n=1 Tax=Hyaloscypha bicolor E TaxID=1095630 RepID=A0A2J6T005_9HELO|nr:uncharacterized protein K444DRAFT_616159 [Hyaloscypha bicolor E]PMD56344.1 hypothetical protein K444DRAFT_616159 [Hyaloscypha bicolor E]